MDSYNISRRQMIIINSLYTRGTLTAAELAAALNVSVRTVKNDIGELKMKFKNSDIEILSKPRRGYSIVIKDREQREYLQGLSKLKSIRQINEFYSNNYERVFYILRRLLIVNDYIKLETIAEEVFVSRSTVNQDMKEVKRLLDKYSLKVVSKPNYGIRIEGTEINKRLCISEYIVHNYLEFESLYMEDKHSFIKNNAYQLGIIEAVLRELCEREKINLSDFSYKNISIHIYISIIRNKLGQTVVIPETTMNRIQSSKTYLITKDICKKLEEKLDVKFRREEEAYISMHIDSKQILDSNAGNEEIIEIEMVLDEIFDEIKNNFNIDVSMDNTLRKYLLLHIPQMIKRIKNHMVVRNPIIHQSLREYLYATEVTAFAAAILENHYRINIELDEFGYLVFYFNMALLNIMGKKAVKIGFINTRGRSESIMYHNELYENFTPPKYEIITFDSINSALHSSGDIDILVSTNNVETGEFMLKVSIEDGDYVEKIKYLSRIKDMINLNMDKYFNEKNIIYDLKGESSEEILNNIYNELINISLATKRKIDAKSFVSYEIGNGIVHLQDLYELCNKPFCLVVVLDKPILWEKSVIRVLFLIKTMKEEGKDLFLLCNLFSKWASDKEKVNKLINDRSFETFISDMLDY